MSGSLKSDLNDLHLISLLSTKPRELRQSPDKVLVSVLAVPLFMKAGDGPELLSMPPESRPSYLGGMKTVCGDLDLSQI